MSRVFIVGLPKMIRSRVEGLLRSSGLSARSILADRQARSGIFILLPDESHAPGMLREYYDSLDSYDLAKVYVLPFAKIPDELDSELDILVELGGEVVEFDMGKHGCPTIDPVNPRLDQAFQDDVVQLLRNEIVGSQEAVLPSAYIREAVAQNPRLVIVGGAIDLCDDISTTRYPWVVTAIDALVELIRAEGHVGEHEPYFAQRSLIHAQSGGITIDLGVHDQGVRVMQFDTSVHLKKGDNTTPQAASRIYFQAAVYKEAFYVFLLYVGPHPDRGFARTHHFPDL